MSGSVGRAARAGLGKVPGVAPLLDKATALAPEEAARLAQEQRTQAAGAYQVARTNQIDDPVAFDVPPPPAAVTPNGAVPAAANGVADVVPPPDAPFVSQYPPARRGGNAP